MTTLSPTNLNLIKEFLENLKAQTAYKFPDYLQNIYSEINGEIINKNNKLRNVYCKDIKLNDDSEEGTYKQFRCFFPTHYFKFLHSLVITELKNIENNSTNILTWQSVTFIDIGCGAGAGSLALLTLIIEYQKFLVEKNQPISPIRIYLIGLDPSENMLSLYKQILDDLKNKFYDYLIDIKYDTLKSAFPKGIKELIGRFNPLNNHSVFLGICNVIRPLSDCFNRGETPAQELINQALNDEDIITPEFGLAETRAIKSILEEWKLDRLSLLSIATQGWDEKLKSITNKFRKEILISNGKGVVEKSVNYYNAKDSAFDQYPYNIKLQSSTYYYDYSTFTNESYQNNQQLHHVLNLENIELAWSRSRRYIFHETFADEAEIKLFDYDIERKLDRLRQQILTRQWKVLNVEHTLFYNQPKNPDKSRPKTLPRIEEQILSASIIQSCSVNDLDLKNSYSHRLNEERDEFLYDYWLDLWLKYIKETHKNAKGNNVFRSDVKGCYQHIKQEELLKIIKNKLSTEERIIEILEKILIRNFYSEVHEEKHDYGCGLSQGHIASGFWAEIYLATIDRIFTQPSEDLDYLKEIKLARYADDMVITFDNNTENFNKIESTLKNLLKRLGLELSDEKTQRFPEDGQEYISETTLDEKLDKLSRKFRRLLVSIYDISDDFIKRYDRQPEQFISEYYQVIKLIGINISKIWLKRKISQYYKERKKDLDFWQSLGDVASKVLKKTIQYTLDNIPKSLKNFFKINHQLEFTEFPIQSSDQQWLDKFKGKNKDWFSELIDFKKELVNLWKDNLSQLNKNDLSLKEEKQAQRRLKFAVGRLCTLGLDEIADDLVKIIIEKPWLVPVHFLCRSLANLDHAFELLQQIVDKSQNSYVKSHAIRALADIKSPLPEKEKGIELICKYIQSEKTSIFSELMIAKISSYSSSRCSSFSISFLFSLFSIFSAIFD